MTARRSDKQRALPVVEPNLQISFYFRLQEIRELYLHKALKDTIKTLDIARLDRQLSMYVEPGRLKQVASFGLRGEVLFPVPYILETNPFLLGYYRLLIGMSQKEFYSKGPFGRFKRLEERGTLTDSLKTELPALCASLTKSAELLVENIDEISISIIHDLQLLTLGPQLRGGANTKIGQESSKEVFVLIKQLVSPYLKEATERTILIENDSRRKVLIEFFSDPDVRITEKLQSGIRPLVSMEIKGGRDVSNIHNRVGEAEKSHQKARNRGFFEFWTIIRVDANAEMVKRESPTTSHFFHLDRIMDVTTQEHAQFRDLLGSLMGIRI